jgi:type I restriction enzyme, S subunit
LKKQQLTTLGELITVVNDNEYEPIKKGVEKYVAGGHIQPDKFYVKKFGYVVDDKDVIGSAFHKLFKKGHILYKTRFPNSGAIATFDGLCSNTTLVLKRNPNSDLIDGLLPFILKWDKFDEHLIRISVGSTNSYVRWRDVADFQFMLPSVSEQIKLKELVWTIQNSIECLEDLLEKTRNYAISKSKLLFTRGIDHTKFKKVKWIYNKTIEIPKEWEIEQGSKICAEITVGIVSKPASLYSENGVSCLRSFNICENKINEKNIVHISEKSNENNFKSKLRHNDVLIVRTGTPGTACVVPEKFVGGNCVDLIIIRPHSRLDSFFLSRFVNSPLSKIQIVRMQGGLAQQHFNLGEMKKLKILLPPLSEQQQITSILSNIDEQINQQQSHLTNLKILRQSVLNSKLTKEKINVPN